MSITAQELRRLTGKRPIIESVELTVTRRPDAAVVEVIGAAPVATISDLVGRLYTMTSEIRPLFDGCPPFCGTAVTVRTARGDNRAVKEAVNHVQGGDVLVVDAQGFTGWCCGGFGMLRKATVEGKLRGLMVNGAYRDSDEFRQADIPLYGISLNPGTGPKIGPGEINVAVSCGNVIVRPGDVIVADPDGVAVVPSEHATRVAEALSALKGAS